MSDDKDWEDVSSIREELFKKDETNNSSEQKITTEASPSEEVKYIELLKEMEELKRALLTVMSLVEHQSEIITTNNNVVETLDTKLGRINAQLAELKKKSEPSRWQYVRDYFLPLLSLTGVNMPFFLMFGLKTGLISFPCSYLFFKIMKALNY